MLLARVLWAFFSPLLLSQILCTNEGCVPAVSGEQLLMCTLLHHLASRYEHNIVGIFDGGQLVGDDECSLVRGRFLKRILDDTFSAGVWTKYKYKRSFGPFELEARKTMMSTYPEHLWPHRAARRKGSR